jgi:uncharacterized protein YrzB (UPF0473 family)
MDDNNEDMITLRDEEGNEIECEVIEWFEFEDKEYIVLLPVDEEELNILRVEKDADGNEVYAVIEDDEEFDKVAEAYDELLGEDEN